MLQNPYDKAVEYLDDLNKKRIEVYQSRYLEDYIYAVEWFAKNHGKLKIFDNNNTKEFIE